MGFFSTILHLAFTWKRFKHKTCPIQLLSRFIQRDLEVTRKLRKQGWQVIRLWGHDIHRQPNKCRAVIDKSVEKARRKTTCPSWP